MNLTATDLAELEPVEVFAHFDGPRFYGCQNSTGQWFLVYWSDEDDSGVTWLYLPVSRQRYLSVKTGKLGVGKAYLASESGSIFVVRSTNGKWSIDECSAQDFDVDLLPPQDFLLQLPDSALPAKEMNAAQQAQASARSVLDLAFDTGFGMQEMAISPMARVLESIQKTVTSLINAKASSFTKLKNEFSPDLMLTTVFESSFGVRLQSRNADLFGDDAVSRALPQLVELLQLVDRPDQILARLREQEMKVQHHFRKLLSAIAKAEVAVDVGFGSTRGDELGARFTLGQVKHAVEILSNSPLETISSNVVIGRLVGIDIETDFFAIVADLKSYRGRIAQELRHEHFKVPSLIGAVIETKTIIDPVTDEPQEKHIMRHFGEPARMLINFGKQ